MASRAASWKARNLQSQLAAMKHGSRNEVANTGVSSRSSAWGGGFDQGILDATLLTKTEMKGVGGEMRSSLRSEKP